MNAPTASRISASIVDDEILSRDLIRKMLCKHEDFDPITDFGDSAQALDTLSKEKPQVIFLDINMPGINGLEFAEHIMKIFDPIIVFITAYDEYAIDAFERNALDYLLKPIEQKRFDSVVNKIRDLISIRKEAHFARNIRQMLANELEQTEQTSSATPGKKLDKITVKENNRIILIDTNSIDYFEASGNYVNLSCSGKNHLIYDTLTNISQRLDSSKFTRIHRSYVVNINQVTELHPHFNGEYIVVLKSGQRLKLSRSYRKVAKSVFGVD
ncbi:LytTR family DNA-binding domain-containing protein [Puniceicoccaceae bacterium K14]|nr:LytTR family DNA-binding domain-containing protein [Puniceicoccaceae bacterium K14]